MSQHRLDLALGVAQADLAGHQLGEEEIAGLGEGLGFFAACLYLSAKRCFVGLFARRALGVYRADIPQGNAERCGRIMAQRSTPEPPLGRGGAEL